jgi:HNH/Endo VII superfamily nuclease toxins
MKKYTVVLLSGVSTLVLGASFFLPTQYLSQAQSTNTRIALLQAQDPDETLNKCDNPKTDEIFDNRSLAYNAAKTRANIPLSQTLVDQWTVGNDVTRRGVSSNYVYIETNLTNKDDKDSALAAMGIYQKFDTPQGPRIVVEHTSDPRNSYKHFHAGQPKGNASDKSYDFRKNRYAAVGGGHHLCYK